MQGQWGSQGWSSPEGFEPSPNPAEAGWFHRVGDGADDGNPENWWQPPNAPPEGYTASPRLEEAGWYYTGDPSDAANWWHDETVVSEPSSLWFTAEQIHSVSYGAPIENIESQWPLLNRFFVEAGASGVFTAIAALATIRVECPPFWPIREYGNYDYFIRMYGSRADLGNVSQEDGYTYRGGGLLQFTGRANYRNYGNRIGVDLEGNPGLILDPEIGARLFVIYFTDRGLTAAAERQDWQRVRVGVNGGLNGWDTFMSAVNAYKAMI